MCLFLIKFWMFLAGSIHLIIGIGVMILGILIQTTDSSIFPDGIISTVDIVSWITIGVGAFIFLSGIMGIVGGIKKLSFCLFVFLIVSIVFALIALTLAIASSVGRSKLEEEIGTSQACIEYFSDINSPLEEAYNYWCTPSCPCYMPSSVFNEYSSDDQSDLETKDENSPTGDRNYKFLDCKDELNNNYPNNGIDFSSLESNQSFFESVEEYFECAGFCNEHNVYSFSNSENGPPKDYPNNVGCYEGVYNKLDTLLKDLIIPLWIVTAVFILNIVMGYVLLCSPQRKEYYNNEKSKAAESQYYS